MFNQHWFLNFLFATLQMWIQDLEKFAVGGNRHEILVFECALRSQLLNMRIPIQPVMLPSLILKIDIDIAQEL